ncbi:MAG TPA: LEA type 2 family protein [Longimicrobiales bacterium]|jgi:LEA14-like dessication related protein
MVRTRRFPVFLSLFIALIVSGCSVLFEAPTVRVADVQIESIGLTGATAAVRFQVENPNRFALTSAGLTYQLALRGEASPAEDEASWRSLASGESTQVVRVRRNDITEVTVSVPFDYADLGFALESLLASGVLRYRLRGDVRFDVLFGEVSVPFEEVGDLGL